MADKRSEYVVEIGGIEHTFLLSEDDAKRYPNAKKSTGAAKRIAEEASRALVAQSQAQTEDTARTEGEGQKAAGAPDNKAATGQTK